jgi:Hemerythrin HHE cation binding domain
MVALNERRVLDGPVDFFMMYAAHDAFSHHMGWIGSALADGKPVAARWALFQHQLHVHHTAEDTALWPALYSAITSRDDRAVLDAMVAEHAEIDPLLERIDDALATDDVPAAGAAVRDLSVSLGGHMRHEENEALPLVARLLGPSGWAAFGQSIRKTQGLRGAAVYLPWLLDGASADVAGRVLGLLPPPIRVLYRLVWLPRYRRALA